MTLLNRFIFEFIIPALCVLGIVYNILITINGPEGMRAHKIIADTVIEEKAVYAALLDEREKLLHRTTLLSGQSLNLDLLDEQARSALGYAAPEEYVVPLSELDRLLGVD